MTSIVRELDDLNMDHHYTIRIHAVLYANSKLILQTKPHPIQPINKGSNLAFHVSSVYVISFMVQPWFLPMSPWIFMSITHIMAPYHDIYRHAQTFMSMAFLVMTYVIMHDIYVRGISCYDIRCHARTFMSVALLTMTYVVMYGHLCLWHFLP